MKKESSFGAIIGTAFMFKLVLNAFTKGLEWFMKEDKEIKIVYQKGKTTIYLNDKEVSNEAWHRAIDSIFNPED
jgi:hypothetical protein